MTLHFNFALQAHDCYSERSISMTHITLLLHFQVVDFIDLLHMTLHFNFQLQPFDSQHLNAFQEPLFLTTFLKNKQFMEMKIGFRC